MITFNKSREIAARTEHVFAVFSDAARLARIWEPAAFTLVESLAMPSGVITANYKRVGEVKTGTIGA